jgi:hypothetical protein
VSVIDSVRGALPEIKLPEVHVPEVKVPDVHLPDVSLDDATKPLYAIVGAGDAAVAKATEQVKIVQDALPTLPGRVSEQLPTLPAKAQAAVTGLPGQLTTLREKATPTTARELEGKVTTKSKELYGAWTGRGHKVVDAMMARPQAQAVMKQMKDVTATVRARLGQTPATPPAPAAKTEAPKSTPKSSPKTAEGPTDAA